MKYALTLLFLLPLSTLAQYKEAREIIRDALADKTGKQIVVDKVIPDVQTAIAVAEPILFKIYGKDQILSEKPYNTSLVDGYWMLSGSLPKSNSSGTYSLGGTFFIILAAKDGRIIKLTHYK